MNKRIRVFISGRVQGVNFRSNTKIQAELFKIKGWVKNLDDGRVEAVFEGETDCVANLLKWCKIGPPGSSVTSIECHDESCSESFRNFTILR